MVGAGVPDTAPACNGYILAQMEAETTPVQRPSARSRAGLCGLVVFLTVLAGQSSLISPRLTSRTKVYVRPRFVQRVGAVPPTVEDHQPVRRPAQIAAVPIFGLLSVFFPLLPAFPFPFLAPAGPSLLMS